MTFSLPDGWQLWWRTDDALFDAWLTRRDGERRWFDAALVPSEPGYEPMLWDEHIGLIATLCRRAAHLSLPRVWACLEFEGGRAAITERPPALSFDEALAHARRTGRPLPLPEAVRAIADVADAIEALRRAFAYAHGTLDPSQFAVTPSGRGVLRTLWPQHLSQTTHITGRSAVAPHVRHLAPEIIRGLPRAPRSDVYGLGLALYEAATNARAIEGDSDMEAITRIVTGPPLPPASARNGAVPAGLDAVIARAIASDPKARFATTGELAEALAPWREGAPWTSWRSSAAKIFDLHASRAVRAHDAMVSASPAPDASAREAFWTSLRDELCERLATGRFTDDDVIVITDLRDAGRADLQRLSTDPQTAGRARPLLARLVVGAEQPRGPRRVRLGAVIVETCDKRWDELEVIGPGSPSRYCELCEEFVTATGNAGAPVLAQGRRCIRFDPTRP